MQKLSGHSCWLPPLLDQLSNAWHFGAGLHKEQLCKILCIAVNFQNVCLSIYLFFDYVLVVLLKDYLTRASCCMHF